MRCRKSKPMKNRAKNAIYCKVCAPLAAAEKRRAANRKAYENMTPAQKEAYLAGKNAKRSTQDAKDRISKYNKQYYKNQQKDQ